MSPEVRIVKFEVRKVEKVSSAANLTKGLPKPQMFEWLPNISIDSIDYEEVFRNTFPSDGTEIVDWMHEVASMNAVLDIFEEQYNACSSKGSNGPKVLAKSGDGATPGVRLSNGVCVVSEEGSVVSRRGYARVKTKHGIFRVPVGGKITVGKKDLLLWAALPTVQPIQFLISLISWVDLASPPINKRVPFPSCRGFVAPNFFKITTKVPSPVVIMRIGITSNKKQTLIFRGRGTKGSYENVMFEDKVEVDSSGQFETVSVVTGFPFVREFTLEIQPEDRTKTILDYLYVSP